MIILGIETSCDETAAAVVRDGKEILSNIIASSVEMHAKTGGIIPEQAAREQVKAIVPVIEQALVDSLQSTDYSPKNAVDRRQKAVDQIDAIAVTYGPGLIGSLLVGMETARTLAWVWNKPLIPVNHLVGHIYANWIDNTPKLPAIALVVSGGHTDMVLVKDHANIEWIGGTRDDAAGECFDKCARLLDLGFPGGPAISAAAEQFTISNLQFPIILPRPLMNDKSFDFSFSGLKTAVLREVNVLKENGQLDKDAVAQLAYEVQEVITDVLVKKTLKAIKDHNVMEVLVCGGVAANSRLREKFELQIRNYKLEISLHVPIPKFCTDNAAMIAAAAFYNHKPVPWQKITTDPGLTLSSI